MFSGLLNKLISKKPPSSTNKLLEILNLYEEYINNNQYIYKRCNNNLIVIMKKLKETFTNEERKNIVDSQYAKYRGTEFKIILIFDSMNLSTTSLFGESHYNKTFIYTIGSIVKEKYFDYNIETVCTIGIHYFNNIIAAYYYVNHPSNYTGV